MNWINFYHQSEIFSAMREKARASLVCRIEFLLSMPAAGYVDSTQYIYTALNQTIGFEQKKIAHRNSAEYHLKKQAR